MSPSEDMLLVLLYYTSKVTLASVTQCEDATNSISNRVLAGHAFFTEQSPNLEHCVMSCIARDPLCESTNYYRKTKVCELNDKTAESNPEDLLDYDWAIYMTFDSECGRQTDICQIKQGGNKCEGKIIRLESLFSNSWAFPVQNGPEPVTIENLVIDKVLHNKSNRPQVSIVYSLYRLINHLGCW